MLTRTARTLSLCLLIAAAPAAPAMDFAALEQLIADRDVRSIEELLPLVPSYMRSRYVLMFRSRSLHGSSFAHPRAILFDPEARFVISFNGDAGQSGFTELETMEFDDASKSFRFREVVFPDSAGREAAVRVSQANPERCLKCHGEPARPIWDTHPVWPGAYGERYLAGLTAQEKSGLQEFLREQPSHPRYRYLLDVDRFANPETFRPAARARYEGSERQPPNAELGAALGRLNFAAIVHQLESRPQFESNKYLLLAALGTQCGRLDTNFPDEQRPGIDAALERFAAASDRANAAQSQSKQLRAVEAYRSGPAAFSPGEGIESLDPFRFVVESRFGLPTRQWTMALEKGSYDFAWSPTASTEMASYLLKRIAQTDPEVKVRADLRSFSDRDPYCAYLAQRSRPTLAKDRSAAATATGQAPDATAPATGPARAQALLRTCADCHGSGVGPPLPFDRPTELASLLRRSGFAHGTLMDEIRWRLAPQSGPDRMPLGTNISDEERDSLLAYFAAMLERGPAP